MKKRIGEPTLGQKITVLSVAPLEEDHMALSRIVETATWPMCPGSQWTLEIASSLPAALSALKTVKPSLVVCESDLGITTWRDLWQELSALPEPPFLIVSSRLADEYLWAEALNLGAYDVLGKPFDPLEVVRSLSQAWLHKTYRHTKKRGLAAIGHPVAEPSVAV